MTTAHRATFRPAIGGSDQGGNRLMMPSRQFSSKDMPGHTLLKERGELQGSKDEVAKMDFKRKLIEAEFKAQVDSLAKGGKDIPSIKGSGAGGDYRRMLQGGDVSERREVSGSLPQAHETINRTERRPAPPRPNLDEDDEDFGSEAEDISENFGRPQKRTKGLGTDMDDGEEDVAYKKAATTGQGRDQDEDEEDDEDKDENDDDDDDDDDDEMAVLLEYERIKKSREEKERKEKEAKYENLTTEEQEEIIKGNPIFDNSYSLDKRWYEETVFRNQAKTEPKAKKRSINDTVRSDFHKKFLKKYIWT